MYIYKYIYKYICIYIGSLIAELNAAHMLELQGFVFESREGYRVALGKYYV
jgi:hypothetical protein